MPVVSSVTGCSTWSRVLTSRKKNFPVVLFIHGGGLQSGDKSKLEQVGLVADAAESEALAASVVDTAGVYIVPAFTGLGAPHWDAEARGLITGITRGAGRAHIVRAALESIAYQVGDLVECFAEDAGGAPTELQVDGGASANDFLMQFQADVLGVPVVRPENLEVTAFGAALLAGLGAGVWQDAGELAGVVKEGARFDPDMGAERRAELCSGWRRAVARACLLYTSPSPRDRSTSRMPSSA